MSNDTTPAGRDPSGRFVKSAAEKVNAMTRTPDDGIHPMSRGLFGWTAHKALGGIIFWTLAALSLLLVLLDLLIERHEKIAVAGSAGFYAIWGVIALTVTVLAAWPLGRLLRRGENYYGDAGGPPVDVDPALAEHLRAGRGEVSEGDQ